MKTVYCDVPYRLMGSMSHNNGYSTQAYYNPFRYRGYYYDRDLSLYYLSTRYYDCRTGRFVSPDNMGYLGANGDLSSYNLYAYCSNNPIMFTDPSGHMPKWLKNVIDIGLYVASAGIAIFAGVDVTDITNPSYNIQTSIDTFGEINNQVNAFYYNYISDGESDLTPSSYHDGYINRADRLDYVKSQKGMPDTYGDTAASYFAEYNLHMYGWLATGWAHKTGIQPFSWVAEKCYKADIDVGVSDGRPYVDIPTKILRRVGL